MATQVNWSKLLQELNKLTDVEHLKKEVHRIGTEIRKFDIHSHLSPSAKARLNAVEKKYEEVSRSINRAQRQVDREFNRVLRDLKVRRDKAEKGIAFVKKAAQEHRDKLEKTSKEIKTRLMDVAATAQARPRKKASSAVKKASPARKSAKTKNME